MSPFDCSLHHPYWYLPHFHSYPTLYRRVFVFIFLTEGVFLFVLFVFALFVCVLFACVLSICVLFFSLQQCVPYACISLVHCVFMFFLSIIYHSALRKSLSKWSLLLQKHQILNPLCQQSKSLSTPLSPYIVHRSHLISLTFNTFTKYHCSL